MDKREKRAEKKLKLLLYESGKLKAKIIDAEKNDLKLKDKEKELQKLKDEMKQYARSNEIKSTEIESSHQAIAEKDKALSDLFMSLAQARAEATGVQSEKENLFYFFQEALKKIKKKEHHISYALSALSDKDIESVQTLYKELGLKF